MERIYSLKTDDGIIGLEEIKVIWKDAIKRKLMRVKSIEGNLGKFEMVVADKEKAKHDAISNLFGYKIELKCNFKMPKGQVKVVFC